MWPQGEEAREAADMLMPGGSDAASSRASLYYGLYTSLPADGYVQDKQALHLFQVRPSMAAEKPESAHPTGRASTPDAFRFGVHIDHSSNVTYLTGEKRPHYGLHTAGSSPIMHLACRGIECAPYSQS